MSDPNNQRQFFHNSFIQTSMAFKDPAHVMVSNKKLQNINQIFKATDTQGGLYIGDIISTLKSQILKDYNIKSILACMCEKISVNSTVDSYKILPIKDILEYPIIQHFEEAGAWIEERRKERNNVLVHCHAGVSRSASIIIAYLIRTQRWTPVQALEYVKQKRQRIRPNASFWSQINEYYNYLKKEKFLQGSKAALNIKNQIVQSSNLQKRINQSNIAKQGKERVYMTIQKQNSLNFGNKIETKIKQTSQEKRSVQGKNKLLNRQILHLGGNHSTIARLRLKSNDRMINFSHIGLKTEANNFSKNKSSIEPKLDLHQTHKPFYDSPSILHPTHNSQILVNHFQPKINISYK